MDKQNALRCAERYIAETKAAQEGFGKLEFGILKTMLTLAAVDGDVSAQEVESFKELALANAGVSGEAFAALWRSALHGAGYLLLQSRLLPRDRLAEEFVREAEADFIEALMAERRVKWTRAFDCLNAIAAADGDYSPVERACVNALVARVRQIIMERGL